MGVDDATCLGVVNEIARRGKGLEIAQGIIGVCELCTVGFFEEMKIACWCIGKFCGFDQSFGFDFFPIAGVIGPFKCMVGYRGCISKNCGGFFCRVATKVILKVDQ